MDKRDPWYRDIEVVPGHGLLVDAVTPKEARAAAVSWLTGNKIDRFRAEETIDDAIVRRAWWDPEAHAFVNPNDEGAGDVYLLALVHIPNDVLLDAAKGADIQDRKLIRDLEDQGWPLQAPITSFSGQS